MLNTEHFVLLAGEPQAWDQEIRERIAKGEDLSSIQVDQHKRGRRSATIAESIGSKARTGEDRDGWYVRAASNLMVPTIIYATTDTFGQLQTAIAYGKNWANRDPRNREFYVRKKDIEHLPL